MNLFVFKIVCPYCGNKHRTNKEGICPHCGKRYLLSQQSSPVFGAALKNFALNVRELVARTAGEIADFTVHTSTRQKKLLAGMLAVMLFILVLFVAAAVNLSTLDADVYTAPERSCIPVIYYSSNTAHCLFKDGKTVELGVGDVKKFDCSSDGDIMYILFSGRITADVDSAKSGDYVVRIDHGKDLEIVVKGETGKVSYLTGGDCEHLFCIAPSEKEVLDESETFVSSGNKEVDQAIAQAMKNMTEGKDEQGESSATDTAGGATEAGSHGNTAEAGSPDTMPEAPSEGTDSKADSPRNPTSDVIPEIQHTGEFSLYYSHNRNLKREVAENVTSTDMTISPNGRYLIFSQADREGSELMKYRVSKKSAEGTDIKNATAISIDNKGKFFTYVKPDATGSVKLYYCRNADKRVSTVLPDEKPQEIIFSADMHSFAIVYDDYTIFKSHADDRYMSIDFDTSSDFGYIRNAYASTVIGASEISDAYSILEGDMFPFFYYDAAGKTIYRVLENGSKSPFFDLAIDDAAVSDNGVVVYTAGNTLYSSRLTDGRFKKNILSESFTYDIYDISPDGKTIYLLDTRSKQVFTMPVSSAKGTTPELLTQDTAFIKASPDSKMLFYTKGEEAYLKRSAGTPRLTDNSIVPEHSCVFTTDFSQFVYAKNMGLDTLGNPKTSLYIFREGKPMFVTENLTRFLTAEGAGFTQSRTNHIFPSDKSRDSTDENASLIID